MTRSDEVHDSPDFIRLQAADEGVKQSVACSFLVLTLNSQEKGSDEPYVFNVDVQNSPLRSLDIAERERRLGQGEGDPALRKETHSGVSRSHSSIDHREQEIRFQYVRNSEIPRFDTEPTGVDPSKVWLCNSCSTPCLAPTTSGQSLRLLNVYRREGQLRVTPNDW